jgi:hypothetical protein
VRERWRRRRAESRRRRERRGRKGGKWSVQLPRGKYSEQIDQYWLYTVSPPSPSHLDGGGGGPKVGGGGRGGVGFFGIRRLESFPDRGEHLSGYIWTRTSSPDPAHKARIENIGRHFKYGVLGFDKGLVSTATSSKRLRADMQQCRARSHAPFAASPSARQINIWTRTSSPDPAHKARIENIGRHFKYGVLGFDKYCERKPGDESALRPHQKG